MKALYGLGITLLALSLVGCSSHEKELKIAASPVPHAEMLEVIRGDLQSQGIRLRIVEIDDYNLPNRLLAESQVDANFFQHEPFLKAQSEACGYDFVILKRVHFEPIGLYSQRLASIQDIPSGGTIAIPSDPTNEARALFLLVDQGLISLKDSSSFITTLSIEKNPKNLRFVEVDAALLPRLLSDVDGAIIPANYALQAGFSPHNDALCLEEGCSPYANILVIRKGSENREDLKKLADLLTSDKMKQWMQKEYRGALRPVLCQEAEKQR